MGCLLEALHTQPVRTFMTGFVVLIEGQLCAVVSGEQWTKETQAPKAVGLSDP